MTECWKHRNFIVLGFEKIFFISSVSGSGTGELLDAISELITEEASEERKEMAGLAKVCDYWSAQCWQSHRC